MKKRFLISIFTILVTVSFIVGLAACGESDNSGNPDGLTYARQGDEYIVTGLGVYNDSNLIIPSEHDGLPVTTIDDNAFYNCKAITSVTIPETVTYIGDYAFYYCNYITKVNIPANVSYIGEYAFYKCTRMENMYYDAMCPETTYTTSFECIGDSASECAVTVGKDCTEIPSYIFASTSLTDVVFEENSHCKSIGSHAFQSCESLADVDLPEGLTTIGSYAFQDCVSLKCISFPESLTTINSYAFYDCTGLTKISLLENLDFIGSEAFSGCESLTEIYFNAKSVSDMDSFANRNVGQDHDVFAGAGQSGTGITVTIGSSVQRIPAYLFYRSSGFDAPYVTTLIFEKNSQCESIGECAFSTCIYLTSVYYSGSSSEWDEFFLDESNYYLTLADIYFYSEIEPTDDGNFWRYVNGEPVAWDKED